MKIIYWDLVDDKTKTSIVTLCGWRKANGELTRTGKRIVSLQWNEMTPATQNVLFNHNVIIMNRNE